MSRWLTALLWAAISLAGAGAFAFLALSRGETISAAWLLVAAVCTYVVGYRFYSKIIAAKIFALDATRSTPAERLADGRDYVPTNKWIVFGHHFAAIAGPGPLVGPTLAAQFGFLPGALWIIIGVVLGGAVQDMVILCASVRRNGKSLGQMAKEEIGPVAGLTAMVAVMGIMIILISVLALVVVNALKQSPWGTVTIGLTIPIAMLMGLYLKVLRPGRVLEVSAIGILLLFVALYVGRWAAQHAVLGPLFTLSGPTLAYCVMVYGFAASVIPVWLLLAPRDYLSAFVKIGVVIALAAGILLVLPPIQMPAVTQFIDGTGPVFAGKVFPFVFITIACGAISGFHALISSGTTPKLLENEADARFIGYGAMLTESLVAIMALIAACVLTPGVYFAINAPAGVIGATAESAATVIATWGFTLTPAELTTLAQQVQETSLLSRTGGAPSLAVGMAKIFADVLGGESAMALWYHFALMFEALFILTTVDAGTRVGRFMLQDLGRHVWEPFGRVSWYPAVVLSSALFVSCWGFFLYQGVTDPLGGINSLWPLFGIANQLLATVALCVGTTVIIKMGKVRYAWMTIIPMCWLVVVTMTAGWLKIFSANPKVGFLAHAKWVAAKVAAGELPAGVADAGGAARLIFNDRLDAAVAAFFMLSVIVILLDSLREWHAVLGGRKPMISSEVPHTPRVAMRTVAAILMLIPTLMLAPSLGAQQPAFDLSVKNIMRGPELYGREPSQVRFTADGQWIYFRWLQPGARWNEELRPFRVAARAGATPETVTDAHMDSVAPMLATGRRTRDGRLEVVAANGDLWLRQRGRPAITYRRITQTVAAESDPKFSLDERAVFFVRENNLFAFDVASGLTRQLTDIRSGAAPKEPDTPTGQRAALAEQQKALLQVVRDELAADSLQAAQRKDAEARRLPVVWIAAAERIGTLSVSPDGKSAIITTFTTAAGAKPSDVPDYINPDGYARMIPGRTKVGDAQGTQKVGHLDLATGKVTWLELTPDKKPSGGAQVGDWSDDGKFALLFVTSADFKHRYLWSVASATGAMAMVDALRDEAWVNGPCYGCIGWTPQGKAWFVSEESGYSHLYAANADGKGKQALTSGTWEVLQVDRASDNVHFMLVTSEPSPFTRQGYRMAMTGGPRTRLTTGDGGHAPVIGPDGATIATVYSTANTPPELFLTRTGATTMSQLTTSTTPEFRSYAWKVPPIVMIPGEDGTNVPARLYTPNDFGVPSNGAAVIFVHGAGYMHNVHNWWSSYSREFMFNHLLASKGYTVLDIDYRGSAGYGRDWRTAIYRWMGGKDLDDQVSGSKYLTKEFGIHPERIGMYGGSYGGFMTLMSLFTKPQHFGAGAALRSVTDWASYNHGYTGRILNLPQDDKESYRKSSPIFFAEGLEDPLLIAHGMVDTNVQFQDVVHLAQRLIELEKTGWEMAVYPVEDHGFVRPTSWADEYRRILELFEETIGPKGSKAGR